MADHTRGPGSAGRRSAVLLGLGPTAHDALCSLAARLRVLAVVRPAVPCDLTDPVRVEAAGLGVPVHPDASPRAVEDLVTATDPDCVVVSSYDRILPGLLVDARPFVNVHYAPLPRYRGRATVNWAILNGEPSTAITVHRLVAGLDAGEILFQREVPIGPHDTVGQLYDRLNALQRACLGETVERFLDGDPGRPQDESAATYACTRLPRDGEIDWSAPTRDVYALVRALGPPFPAAFTHLDGTRLEVCAAEPVTAPPRYDGRVPGRVVGRSHQDGHVDVLTGDGVLRLRQVAHDGGEPVAAAGVIRSVRTTLGMHAGDLLDRIAALEAALAVALARAGDGSRR